MAKWLDKYEQGGLVLKKKTKDNYGTKPNVNDVKVSAGPNFVGEGYTAYNWKSPAWGGQFQDGGILGKTFLQPTSPKLPAGPTPGGKKGQTSTELAMSIGGGPGEPAYLIPTFKHGKPLKDPEAEFRQTGEHLGGPFKTWQAAEKFGKERHKYVEQGKPVPAPLRISDEFQMGGSMPGAVGFMYARTQNPAPSNGKYTKKTQASAQNGQEMKFYQDGLDFKPKSISQDGRNISKELKKEAEEKLKRMGKPKATISQYTPKPGEQEKFDREKLQRIEEENAPLNRFASSKAAKNIQDALEFAAMVEGGIGASKLVGKGAKSLAKQAYKINPLAEKLVNPNMAYRIADEASYQDFLRSGVVRPKSLTPEFQNKTFTDLKELIADRTTSFPSFAKGEPAWGYLPKEGKGYIYTTEQPVIRRGDINPVTGKQVGGRHWAYRPIDEQTGKVFTELPADKVKVYSAEPHWLKGYQEVPKKEEGGVIKDDRGQWAHPGEITEIGSNQITMKGVDYPVLGVSDTGDTKMMKPGKDYKFKGTKVTEYPKGGWLNKYK